MKLISCTIENFGKIKHRHYDFSSSWIEQCEPNGAGKSTLAAFIKAMFYGMETVKKTNVKESDRKHFYPFDGGLFGGNLVFSHQNQEYRIERVFDEKSQKKDTVRIFKNGLLWESSDEIGEVIFGVDKESFERTVFITSQDFDFATTDRINSKLNDLVEGGSKEANLKTALTQLDQAISRYSNRSSGRLKTVKDEVTELKRKADNLQALEKSLFSRDAELKNVRDRIALLTEEIESAQQEQLDLANWNHFETLFKNVKETEEKIQEISARYPLGYPPLSMVESVLDAASKQTRLEDLLKKDIFTADDQKDLQSLTSLFSEHIPDEDELKEIDETIKKTDYLSYQIDSLENKRTRLFEHLPTDNDRKEFGDLWEQYQKQEEQLDQLTNQSQTPPQKISLFGLLVFLSLGCFTASGFSWGFKMSLGIVFLVLGCVCAGLAIWFGGSVRRKKQEKTHAVLLKQEEKKKIQQEMEAILLRSFIPSGGDLKTDAERFFKICLESDQLLEEKKRLEAERTPLKERLATYFTNDQVLGSSYQEQLFFIKSAKDRYQRLLKRKEESDREKENNKHQYLLYEMAIEKFSRQYQISIDRFSSIKEDLTNLKQWKEELRKRKEAYSEFQKLHSLKEKPTLHHRDLSSLQQQLQQYQEEKKKLELEIAEDERTLEEKDEVFKALQTAQDRLVQYQNNHRILSKTKDFLLQAETQLKEKYIHPIRSSFEAYSGILEEVFEKKVTIDPDLNVKFEANGLMRSDLHLSLGERSIYALCFRLALIDNMYRKEKPFLILDDPFVHLDADHLKKAEIIMKELSSNRQILYLTCHESRLLKAE